MLPACGRKGVPEVAVNKLGDSLTTNSYGRNFTITSSLAMAETTRHILQFNLQNDKHSICDLPLGDIMGTVSALLLGRHWKPLK